MARRDRVNADIALKNRLYVSGWNLSGDLKYIRDGGEGCCRIVYKGKGQSRAPAAVSVRLPKYEYTVAVFVKKSERGKGYGTKALKAINFSTADKYGRGVAGSGTFFSKVLHKTNLKGEIYD